MSKEYADKFVSMLEVMDCQLTQNENGSYCVYDEQSGDFRHNADGIAEFNSAAEIVENLEALIVERIVENMENVFDESVTIDGDAPAGLEEIDKFLKNNPDVVNNLNEIGYNYDVEYIDLLVNHVNDVQLEDIFYNFIDEIWIDEHDAEAVIFDEIGSGELTMSAHLSMTDKAVEELLNASEINSEDRKNIEYVDLYAEYSLAFDPQYTVVATMPNSKFYAATEEDSLHLPDNLKTAIDTTVEKHLDKSIVAAIMEEMDKEKNSIGNIE